LQLAERDKAAEADRRAVLAQAKRIADAVIALNGELDAELVRLREMFERRMSLLRELAATGVAEAVVTRLQGKGPVTRACCAARLHAHIALEKVAQGSFVTLASTNPILMGVGRDRPDGSADLLASNKSNGGAAPPGKIFGAEVTDD
jgi:hypothetical protein